MNKLTSAKIKLDVLYVICLFLFSTFCGHLVFLALSLHISYCYSFFIISWECLLDPLYFLYYYHQQTLSHWAVEVECA